MTTARVTLPLYNLGCGGGEALTIERAIARLPGVTQVYINPLTEMAYVVYDQALLSPEQLQIELGRLGYGAPTPVPRYKSAVVTAQPTARSWHLYRQAIAGGLGLAIIYIFSLALGLLFPALFQIARLWEMLLPGLRLTIPWTLLLGLGETFLLGAISILLLTELAHTIQSHAARS